MVAGTPRKGKTDDELVDLFTGIYREGVGKPGEGRHNHFRSVVGLHAPAVLRLAARRPARAGLLLGNGALRAVPPRVELERNFANLLERERTRIAERQRDLDDLTALIRQLREERGYD